MSSAILIIFFLLLSALFSGTEIAFISADKLQLELKKKKGSRRGKILARFFDDQSRFIGTMLVGNNIALVAFTIMMEIPLKIFMEDAFGVSSESALLLINTLLITLIVLVFGEFLPKTLFRLFANDVLFFLAFPLRLFHILLAIPAWIMTKLSNLLLKYVFRTSLDEDEEVFTRLDLENYIKSSSTDDDDEIDTELFEKALNLREVRVRECMVPRLELASIEVNSSVDDLKGLIQESYKSRIIVFEEDIDQVIGYVHHQSLLKKPKKIQDALMEIPIVPEAMRVKDLLNQFIKNKMSIACVVDEYGGTAGIITMEDILEEIFGEIEDEHDSEDYIERQINDTTFVFSGRLELDYLNEKYTALSFPENEEYHTLSGYIVMETGSIPNQKDEIFLGDYKFTLQKMSDTKIETVKVEVLTEEVGEEENE